MSESTPLNTCGCCEGISVETPVAIYNRPGLPAIAYRIGTYASFRESLLARLSDSRFSVLRQLRTRDNDDFTIALLDAWAVTSDVLTFYQERIAHESYLRTATERLSILEQSRLLGYQLAPGLAASTYLAFTMESTPGAPELAPKPLTVAIGTRVQSVPGPDEQPQSFETIEAVEARAEWNAILPQLTEPQTLAWDMTQLWLEGANLTLAVGDVLMVISASDSVKQASLRRVVRISVDAGANRTGVTLAAISDVPQAVSATAPGVFVMRVNASPFGHNAPKETIYKSTGAFDKFQEWLLDGESDAKLTLSSRQEKILIGSWAVVERENNFSPFQRLWAFAQVTAVAHLSAAKYGIAGSATQLNFDKDVWVTEQADLAALRKITVVSHSEALTVAPLPLTYPVYGSKLALDGLVDGLSINRPIAVSGKRQRLRIKPPNVVSAARTKPGFDPRLPGNFPDIPDFPDLPDLPDIPDINLPPILILDAGGIVVLKPGDWLFIAAAPMTITGSVLDELTPEGFSAALGAVEPPRLRLLVIDRDGKTGRVDISADAIELVAAGDGDETLREIAFIDDEPTTAIVHDRDRTTLQLANPLANVFDRATMRINANVAAATHGESVKELLGSGDATIAYQSFVLRQPPLTYVSAETPSGRASTLKIYVNDVAWQEAQFFYGRGPTERIYTVRQDDDGRTTVMFGDGTNGARLPTGQNNVRAEYRKGAGLGGLVEAGQLSQLLSRPLGLREVTNPEAAAGAEDGESLNDARRNAPTTVLTLDRAVSLQDYEDFARTFAGIAKAQAVWVWDGRKRSIFLTVAGADGAVLQENGSVIVQLKEALREYGDPFVLFTVKSYRQALFQIHGTITIDSAHVIDTVMAAVTADLSTRYSFDARSFGQPVALSEAIAAIQAIAGVVAVDIDKFYRNNAPLPTIQPRLIADRPAMGADGAVAAAELLLLDETSLDQLKATQ